MFAVSLCYCSLNKRVTMNYLWQTNKKKLIAFTYFIDWFISCNYYFYSNVDLDLMSRCSTEVCHCWKIDWFRSFPRIFFWNSRSVANTVCWWKQCNVMLHFLRRNTTMQRRFVTCFRDVAIQIIDMSLTLHSSNDILCDIW